MRRTYQPKTKQPKQPKRVTSPEPCSIDAVMYRSPSEIFLHLARYSVPYKHEAGYYGDMLSGLGFQLHPGIGYYLEVGRSGIIYTSHLDVAILNPERLQLERSGSIIWCDDYPIGADDRLGVALMLWMVQQQIPGRYWLFLGEERGCVGSKLLNNNPDLSLSELNIIVSFDRKGTTELITHQLYTRLCDERFAAELCTELQSAGMFYEPSDDGIYTDGAYLAGYSHQTVNISIGYYNNHFAGEVADIGHVDRLGEAVNRMRWSQLEELAVETSVVADDTDDTAGYDRYPSLAKSQGK